MAKKKCKCPKPGLTAPFYLLTYGDMMTLLLTFFVLLFSMSTIQVVKFQAQVGVIQGALGISQMYQHAPMQKSLPAPSVKESPRIVSRSIVDPEDTKPLAEYASVDSSDPMREQEVDEQRAVKAVGTEGDAEISPSEDEMILVLPTWGIFEKGSWTINPPSPEVRKAQKNFTKLASQIGALTNYDVEFVGHTDSLPILAKKNQPFPKNNMELGFLRAVALYEFFFKDELADLTRITFSSQGDNVPVVPNASLDSERRKNRRVQIHLKKRKGDGIVR